MGLTTQGEEMNANDSSNQRLRMKVVALAVAAAVPLASATMPDAPEMRFTSAWARSGSGIKAVSEPSLALPTVMPRR